MINPWLSALNTSRTIIPTRWVGPIRIHGNCANGQFDVPMATYETTLWPSTKRGIKVTGLSGGINTLVIDDRMSRSVVMEAKNATQALNCSQWLDSQKNAIADLIKQQSSHATLSQIHIELLGRLIYIRLEISCGAASGHNMVTKAADHLIRWIEQNQPHLSYVSISANMCVDKKVSAINGILGRGKRVIAECCIPRAICTRYLRVTPEQLINLNIKKNLLGSTLAGSIRSANSHFANLLLAVYLATGQDAANIVEGSQGIVTADIDDENLYFAVTLPNIIVGTVGNGKHHGFVLERLKRMQCIEEEAPGISSQRLAAIIAATVLCGELSCLAAQCNQGELTRSHMYFERTHRLSNVGE